MDLQELFDAVSRWRRYDMGGLPAAGPSKGPLISWKVALPLGLLAGTSAAPPSSLSKGQHFSRQARPADHVAELLVLPYIAGPRSTHMFLAGLQLTKVLKHTTCISSRCQVLYSSVRCSVWCASLHGLHPQIVWFKCLATRNVKTHRTPVVQSCMCLSIALA